MSQIPVEVYQYSRLRWTLATVLLIMGFVPVIAAIFIASQMLQSRSVTFDDVIDLITLFAMMFVISFIFVIGFYTQYILCPDIHVRNNEFRLSSWLYQSDWISWDEINFIERPVGSILSGYETYGIGLDRISHFYEIGGRGKLLPGRAFIVIEFIQNFEQFMQHVEQHRPDLFEDGRVRE